MLRIGTVQEAQEEMEALEVEYRYLQRECRHIQLRQFKLINRWGINVPAIDWEPGDIYELG